MIQVIHKIAIRPARRKSSTLHSHLVNNALLLYKYQTINAFLLCVNPQPPPFRSIGTWNASHNILERLLKNS